MGSTRQAKPASLNDKIMVAKEFVEEFKDSYENEEYDFMGRK